MDKETAKKKLGAFGNGLVTGLVALADIGPSIRMSKIEEEIDALQEEYANLNEQLDSSRKRPVPYTK